MANAKKSDMPVVVPILLRPGEAARALAISPRKLWEMTNRGEISCIRVGRAVRYEPRELERWVRGQKKKFEEDLREQRIGAIKEGQ